MGVLVSCADNAPKPKLPAAFPAKAAANSDALPAPAGAATNAISSAKPNAIDPAIPAPTVAADPLTSSATSNASVIELPAITMPKPAAWTWVKPSMQFRTLQYKVCHPGSGQAAPCADLIVSVFQLGDGGSVDANIDRWKNQFQNAQGAPAQPTRSQRMVAGLSVTRVDMRGAWKGMGMSEAQTNFEQLAAVIELPRETIYIRMVGSEATVESARKDFEAMVDGIAPRAPLGK